MGPVSLPAPLSPTRGPKGNLAPGVAICVPEGLPIHVARRSRRHPDHPGGRFGAEGRSLLPHRFSVDPKPLFHVALRLFDPPCPARGFGISSIPRRKFGHALAPSLLRSFLIRDPREVCRTLVRPLPRGFRRHVVRYVNFPWTSVPCGSIPGRFVPFRQAKGDLSERVVQAGKRQVIHRSPIWRWTKVDKPVIGRGFAAYASVARQCGGQGWRTPSYDQRPRFDSSFRRRALSLMKPSASFWS